MQSFEWVLVLCYATKTGTADAWWPQFGPTTSRVCTLQSYIVVLKVPSTDERERLWQEIMRGETSVQVEVRGGYNGYPISSSSWSANLVVHTERGGGGGGDAVRPRVMDLR